MSSGLWNKVKSRSAERTNKIFIMPQKPLYSVVLLWYVSAACPFLVVFVSYNLKLCNIYCIVFAVQIRYNIWYRSCAHEDADKGATA